MPFSRTIIVLIRPAIPLAPSRCPMLDFMAPLGKINQESVQVVARRMRWMQQHPYLACRSLTRIWGHHGYGDPRRLL